MRKRRRISRNRINRFNSSRTSRVKRMTRRNNRHRGIQRVIIFGVIVFTVLAAFLAVRNLFFFITESSDNPENPYPVKGVDVSSYQRDIDWKGLESEGIRFAFIKATEGSDHRDGRFEYNWKEANGTDMKVGAYHFLSYDTPGETQAENYIGVVDKKWGMLPPVVDVEFYGEYLENHPSSEKVYKVLDVVLDMLEKEYGKKPIIYTNTHIYNTYISGEYDDYHIWISNPDIPDSLPDGKDWIFCQYTFKGVSQYVAGGEKYVDMNVFNGNAWEFRKYNGK